MWEYRGRLRVGSRLGLGRCEESGFGEMESESGLKERREGGAMIDSEAIYANIFRDYAEKAMPVRILSYLEYLTLPENQGIILSFVRFTRSLRA
jgi:hypothetical protein